MNPRPQKSIFEGKLCQVISRNSQAVNKMVIIPVKLVSNCPEPVLTQLKH